MTTSKKDDRLSHQSSIKVPHFIASKRVGLSLGTTPSRRPSKSLLQNIYLMLELLH